MMSKKSSYSRKFPELFPKAFRKHLVSTRKWFKKSGRSIGYKVTIFILINLILFSFVLTFVFVELLDQYKTVQEEQASIRSELLYWENALATVPNSPDIYFQAGVAAFQLGDKVRANTYINKALELDPQFESARELQERIEE